MTDGWTIATAVGTILAAAVPAVLFFVERAERMRAQTALDEELRRQARHEAERAKSETMTEARRVAIWNESGSNGSAVTIHVLNGSSDPVYQVAVSTEPMRTTEGRHVTLGVGWWDVLLPGEHVTESTHQAAPMPAWVDFVDVRDRRWTRRNDGSVERHTHRQRTT